MALHAIFHQPNLPLFPYLLCLNDVRRDLVTRPFLLSPRFAQDRRLICNCLMAVRSAASKKWSRPSIGSSLFSSSSNDIQRFSKHFDFLSGFSKCKKYKCSSVIWKDSVVEEDNRTVIDTAGCQVWRRTNSPATKQHAAPRILSWLDRQAKRTYHYLGRRPSPCSWGSTWTQHDQEPLSKFRSDRRQHSRTEFQHLLYSLHLLAQLCFILYRVLSDWLQSKSTSIITMQSSDLNANVPVSFWWRAVVDELLQRPPYFDSCWRDPLFRFNLELNYSKYHYWFLLTAMGAEVLKMNYDEPHSFTGHCQYGIYGSEMK